MKLFYAILFLACSTIGFSHGFQRNGDGGECDTTSNFGSFNGKPATTIADCIWDSFSCQGPNPNAVTREQATCCAQRFDNCCMYVMNPETFSDSLSDPQMLEESTTPGPPPPPEKPYEHANTLIGCIWQFNNCVQEKYNQGQPDTICQERVEECKMIVMGMIPPPNAATQATQVIRGGLQAPAQQFFIPFQPSLPQFLPPFNQIPFYNRNVVARPPLRQNVWPAYQPQIYRALPGLRQGNYHY